MNHCKTIPERGSYLFAKLNPGEGFVFLFDQAV